MNPYRMAPPSGVWDPRLKPRLVRLLRPFRARKRIRTQQVIQVEVRHAERLRQAIDANWGILITPNHATHADPYTMYALADHVDRPFYFMSTWHVFDSQPWIGQKMLQWHGAFSVDREANDLRAFKLALHILQNESHPLVIFPEGEVYHCNDRVTPFRDGAAAIALASARRSERPIVCVPCGLKYRYLEDPTAELERVMDELERRVFWRPRRQRPLTERIYSLAEALLALKELEFLGQAAGGPLPQRIRSLAEEILRRLEQQCGIPSNGFTIPERVKQVRRHVLEQLGQLDATDPKRSMFQEVLDDVFLVVQLFSYPGDYVAERPTIERLAETLDKLEEDVLGIYSATIRGKRAVTVAIGEPIALSGGKGPKNAVAELTESLEAAVQGLLDELNGASRSSANDECLSDPSR
jgi:1-acyl-sn-glycerol-3-phosphate acyltransferase